MLSRLTDDEMWKFLIHVYFKNAHDTVGASTGRAYRDFSRTLHGLRKLEGKSVARSAAEAALQDAIKELTSSPVASQGEFDSWHKSTCDELKNKFGSFYLYYGQAQKWINMSMKYLFVLERSRVEPYWEYCHIPIDNIVLERLKGHEPPTFTADAWSRIDSYDEYRRFQEWFRNEFPGIPMDEEWRIWLNLAPGS